MKTTWMLALALGAGATLSLPAQNLYVFGAVNTSGNSGACPAGPCPAVRAPAPAAPACAAAGVRARSPDVIFVGAASGYPRPNFYSGCGYEPGYAGWSSPHVISFGLGQAYVHGYYFRHCR